MSKRLFGTTDRDAAHAELDRVRKAGKHPRACCREDPNDEDHPYQVWDGPPDAHVRPPEEQAAVPALNDDQMEQLADRVASKLAALLAPTPAKAPTKKPAKKGAR